MEPITTVTNSPRQIFSPEVKSEISLPTEIFKEIASLLDFDEFKAFSEVSRGCNGMVYAINAERKKAVEEAFGNPGCLTPLRLGTPEPTLPRNIVEILYSPCDIDPTKKVCETFMLTLIGPGSVKEFGELVKKEHFPKTEAGYGYAPLAILDACTANGKSYWALMSKDVLVGTRDQSFNEQQKKVAELSQKVKVYYEVPTALEAGVSILTYNIRSKSGERLFGDKPWTFTRCLDVFNKTYQVVVGGFGPSGLSVDYDYYVCGHVGVAALRKFRPLAIG